MADKETAAPAAEKSESKKRKSPWLTIGIVGGVLAVLLIGLIVAMRHFGGEKAIEPAPVLLAQSSHFEYTEDRTDSVLLFYTVTLRNDTDKELRDFALRGVLESDYKSGFLLSSEASVRIRGEQNSTFTLAAGETKTFDLVLTAKFHKTQRVASGDLPQLYAVYPPDGAEGKIKIVNEK